MQSRITSGPPSTRRVEGSPAGGSQGSGILANPSWRPNPSGYNRPCPSAPVTSRPRGPSKRPCLASSSAITTSRRSPSCIARTSPDAPPPSAHPRRGSAHRRERCKLPEPPAQALNPWGLNPFRRAFAPEDPVTARARSPAGHHPAATPGRCENVWSAGAVRGRGFAP